MPRRCPHCNGGLISKPISKLPLWEGNPFKSKFNWEALKWKNLNLKNLIIGDLLNFMLTIFLLLALWSYGHDSEAYREIYSNPCDYVMKNIDVCIEFEKNDKILWIDQDLIIREANLTEIPAGDGGEK